MASEAIADILRETGDAAKMRSALIEIEKMAHCDLGNVYPKYRNKFNNLVGGIERIARAALAAPPSEPVTDCNQSNAAKVREAMVGLTDKVLDYLHNGLIQLPLPIEEANAKARAALSAPPRNCDVGTAEEQAHRFHDFCVAHQSQIHGMCSPYCPCIGLADMCHCLSQWAQMPCKESGVAK